MKKIKFTLFTLATLVITSTFLFSCSDLAFDIDQTFSESFDVFITEANTGGADIELNKDIDVSAGELKENIERVEEVTIKSIKINFSNYTGDNTAKVNGSLTFPQILTQGYKLPELDVHNYSTTGEPFVLYAQDETNFPGDASFPAQEFIDNLTVFLKTLPANKLNTTFSLNSTAYPIGFNAEIEIDIFAKVSAAE